MKHGRREVRLPSPSSPKNEQEYYRLWAWKVSEGAMVREGQVLALAKRTSREEHVMGLDDSQKGREQAGSVPTTKNTTETAGFVAVPLTSSSTSPPSSSSSLLPAHKRPPKRRRPGSVAAPAAGVTTDPPAPAVSESIVSGVNSSQQSTSAMISQINTSTPSTQFDLKGYVQDHQTTATNAASSSSTATTKMTSTAMFTSASSSLYSSSKVGSSDFKPIVAPSSGVLRIITYPTTNESTQTNIAVPQQAEVTSSGDYKSHSNVLNSNLLDGKNDEPLNIVIGYIDECQHSTIVDGLCALCGQSVSPTLMHSNDDNDDHGNDENEEIVVDSTTIDDDNDNVDRKSFHPSKRNSSNTGGGGIGIRSRMTLTGGVTVSVSEQEGLRIAQQDAERLRRQDKLSLVLDLDHTLVHATSDIRARQYLNQRPDVRSLILPITDGSMGQTSSTLFWMQHFVKLRPYVKEFLQMAQLKYEIGVYTAGTRDYAEQITMMLARHVVGADLDGMDLQYLRQQVAQLEAKVHHHQQLDAQLKVEDNVTSMFQFEHPKIDNDPSATRTNEDVNTSDTSNLMGTLCIVDSSNSSSSIETSVDTNHKKRKRVTFGSQPDSDEKTYIGNQLLEWKKKLSTAEELERQAIDMRQRLFGNRVVSRTDVGDLGRDVKSIKRIFPCGGIMAVVVDDREDVWANAVDDTVTRPGEPPENLLLVRPYHWTPFLGFADVNNVSGPDLSGTTTTSTASSQESTATTDHESDEQLAWTADILQRLHGRFYEYKHKYHDNSGTQMQSSPPQTVAEVLRQMRLEVLQGGVVVLSGLVPLHKQLALQTSSNTSSVAGAPPRPPVVRYVELLGAVLQTNVTTTTTHVVAAHDGTDKTTAARAIDGCYIVKVSWLMECLCSLTRRNETPHLFAIGSSGGGGRGHISEPGRRKRVDDNDNNSSYSTTISSSVLDKASLMLSTRAYNNSTGTFTGNEANNEIDDSADDDDDLVAELECEMMDE